jgi:hypothetical protein
VSSFKRPRVFLPLDLEIIDLVHEAAWAQIEARDPFRNRNEDGERQDALRKQLFALATPGTVDFDTLYDKVLAKMSDTRTMFSELIHSPQAGPSVGDEGTAP